MRVDNGRFINFCVWALITAISPCALFQWLMAIPASRTPPEAVGGVGNENHEYQDGENYHSCLQGVYLSVNLLLACWEVLGWPLLLFLAVVIVQTRRSSSVKIGFLIDSPQIRIESDCVRISVRYHPTNRLWILRFRKCQQVVLSLLVCRRCLFRSVRRRRTIKQYRWILSFTAIHVVRRGQERLTINIHFP